MIHEKEIWVNQILESANQRTLQKVPNTLQNRLNQIPETVNCAEKKSSTWLIAACVCLLVTLNIFTLESVKQNSGNKSSEYSEYFSFLEPIS